VQDSRTKEAVRKLADDFRYSDPVSSPARKITEARIPSLIDTLEQAVKEQRQEEITAVIAQIKETLARAKCEVQKKLGIELVRITLYFLAGSNMLSHRSFQNILWCRMASVRFRSERIFRYPYPLMTP
jgi:hypothetical protein